jgi:hypothetical protein
MPDDVKRKITSLQAVANDPAATLAEKASALNLIALLTAAHPATRLPQLVVEPQINSFSFRTSRNWSCCGATESAWSAMAYYTEVA